jgi:hypothetical protein
VPGADDVTVRLHDVEVLTTPPFFDVPPAGSPGDVREAPPGMPPTIGRIPGRIVMVRPVAPIIGQILPVRQPVPRDQITGPVSPVPQPSDETLFEDARNAQSKFYLPRYRVAEEMVSGKAQFRMRLEQLEQGGRLTVFLEKFPAPALATAARTAAEISHSIGVTLKARVPVGTTQVQQDLAFQEVTFEGALAKAVLRLESLAQVTQLFQILTEASFSASLTIVRSFSAGLPVPAEGTPQVRQLTARVQALTQEMAAFDRQLAPLRAQRLQLQRLARTRPEARQRFNAVQAQMTAISRQRLQKKRELDQANAQLAALRQQTFYQASRPVLEWAVGPQPFVFPKELHPYIFGALIPGAGTQVGLTPHQVLWNERSHSYYRQTLNPHRFFFLPDAFKVRRKAEVPRGPQIAVRFPNPDAPPETMPVTLEYVAAAVTDSERLQAAAAELKRKMPELAAGDRVIEFESLLSDTTRLFMNLPRGDAGPQLEERRGATVDLRSGILDAVTLPMKDFQGVFDALFGASAVVFQGEVVVELDRSGAIPAERIPVVCRLDDLDGDVFDISETADAASGGVTATLRNAIESPLEVRGLQARLVRGEMVVDATVRGAVFDPPPVLKPAESLSCEVVPAAPLAGSGNPTAAFNLGQVKVQADAQAVWDAVVDKSRLPEFNRAIKVKTIKQTFDARPENPSDAVVAVVVDFERGTSVELAADKLEAEAKVGLALEDFVLRRLQTGEYRYKVTLIRANGGQARDSEWRTDTTGILFPRIVSGPAPQ